MKKVLFILFLSIIAFNADAQKVNYGFHIGANLNGLYGGDNYRVYNNKMKVGYNFGADVCLSVSKKVKVFSGLSLLQTSGKFSAMSNYLNTEGKNYTEYPEINVKLISLEIPIKFGYEFEVSKNLSLIPNIGVYGRYALASLKDKIATTGYDNTEKWDALKDYNRDLHHVDGFKKYDIGVCVGVKAQISNHYILSLDYNHGIIEQSKQYKLKNRGLSLSIGYNF